MSKWIISIIALALISPAVGADEYPVIAYLKDGSMLEGAFITQNSAGIQLRIQDKVTTYAPADLGVVIFNNNFTNFNTDLTNYPTKAAPHMVVMKGGQLITGTVMSFTPNGKISVSVNQMHTTYDAVQVARIYYNPEPFFSAVTITGNNIVEITQAPDEQPEDKTDKKDKKKDREKKDKVAAEKLYGGRVYIEFKNGGSTQGVIYDVMGEDPILVLTDGRRFSLRDLHMINYEEAKGNYKGDDKLIQPGWATFIMKNGGAVTGQVYDYLGDNEWMFTDQRRVKWDQISRIYFP